MPGGNYVPDPEGDAMTFLDDCIAKVEDYRNQNDSTVTVLIRFIVHLVGDMHCPGPVSYTHLDVYKRQVAIIANPVWRVAMTS